MVGRLNRSLGVELQPGLPAPRDDLDAEDRIAAQLEEVIVDADPVDAAERRSRSAAMAFSVPVRGAA